MKASGCSIHQLHEAARTVPAGDEIISCPRHAVGGELVGQAPGPARARVSEPSPKPPTSTCAWPRSSSARALSGFDILRGQHRRAGVESERHRRRLGRRSRQSAATVPVRRRRSTVAGRCRPGTLGKGGGGRGSVSPASAPGEGAETPAPLVTWAAICRLRTGCRGRRRGRHVGEIRVGQIIARRGCRCCAIAPPSMLWYKPTGPRTTGQKNVIAKPSPRRSTAPITFNPVIKNPRANAFGEPVPWPVCLRTAATERIARMPETKEPEQTRYQASRSGAHGPLDGRYRRPLTASGQ